MTSYRFLSYVAVTVILLLCWPDTLLAQSNTLLVGPTSLVFTFQTGCGAISPTIAAVVNAASFIPAAVAPGLVSGVIQVNAQTVASGNVPVQISLGGASSQLGVTLGVQ